MIFIVIGIEAHALVFNLIIIGSRKWLKEIRNY
jgi:hypothetical protein